MDRGWVLIAKAPELATHSKPEKTVESAYVKIEFSYRSLKADSRINDLRNPDSRVSF